MESSRSTVEAACCCGNNGCAVLVGRGEQCSNNCSSCNACPSAAASSSGSCVCRCSCSSSGHDRQQRKHCGDDDDEEEEEEEENADDGELERRMKQVNWVFTAAEAALQAFRRAAIARVGMSMEGRGGGAVTEEAYGQVKRAARSQAAASIAWVIAAAELVLQEDDEDEGSYDSTADVHAFQYGQYGAGRPGRTRSYSHVRSRSHPYNYPLYTTGRPLNSQRRPPASADPQLSTNYSRYLYKSMGLHHGAYISRSLPRWEWRPILNTTPSASAATSSSTTNVDNISHASKTLSSSLHHPQSLEEASTMPIPAISSTVHPFGVPSITISSLLPPLINCRISDTPYNQPKGPTESNINPAISISGHQNHDLDIKPLSLNQYPSAQYEQTIKISDLAASPCKESCAGTACSSACGPLDRLNAKDDVAIDIIVLDSKTSEQTFCNDEYGSPLRNNQPNTNLSEKREVCAVKEESNQVVEMDKLGTVAEEKLSPQNSPRAWSEDNFLTSSSFDLISMDRDAKPDTSHTLETNPINSKNHKKHLKKKQKKASASHF